MSSALCPPYRPGNRCPGHAGSVATPPFCGWACCQEFQCSGMNVKQVQAVVRAEFPQVLDGTVIQQAWQVQRYWGLGCGQGVRERREGCSGYETGEKGNKLLSRTKTEGWKIEAHLHCGRSCPPQLQPHPQRARCSRIWLLSHSGTPCALAMGTSASAVKPAKAKQICWPRMFTLCHCIPGLWH